MRYALLLTAAMLATAAHADCMDQWAHTGPEGVDVLPAQGRVLVKLGGALGKLDLTKALEFRSGAQRVAPTVVSSFDGYRQRIAVITPARALQPGRWDLVFVKPDRFMPTKPLGSWMVTNQAPDTTPPAFTGRPKAGETKWQEYGCGPGSFLAVDEVATNEPALLEAQVTFKGTTQVVTLAMNAKEPVLQLGHGMCSGVFEFPHGAEVTVVLTPVDLSGNRGPPSEPLRFTAPAPAR